MGMGDFARRLEVLDGSSRGCDVSLTSVDCFAPYDEGVRGLKGCCAPGLLPAEGGAGEVEDNTGASSGQQPDKLESGHRSAS